MKIGVVLPQTEIGNDPGAIKAYAEAVEDMGFTHILVFDHVLGANPERPGGWKGPYTYRHAFHEPFVLFGFLAAATRRVGLVTGIVILPQRQTALVAKQAAAVDVLSGGRLRLGVGVGWNPVEFEALGEDFHTRGRRVEEQVQVMRALWTKELVTFTGAYHRIPDAGLNPLPVQRPIPVWMGGESPVVLRRAARLADGWITLQTFRPGPAAQQTIDGLHAHVREAGRDPAKLTSTNQLAIYVGESRQQTAADMRQWLSTEWDTASWSESTIEHAVHGSASECVEQLRAHVRTGVHRIILIPYRYQAEQVERIAKEVLPKL